MTDIPKTCPAFDPATHRATGAFAPGADETGADILIEVVEPIPPGEIVESRVAEVKAAAGRRILAIAPEWMQRNLTARAAELALLHPGTKGVDLPEPERSEYLAGQAVWERIRAIRVASNEIEAALSAATSADGASAADVLAVDISAGWPD